MPLLFRMYRVNHEKILSFFIDMSAKEKCLLKRLFTVFTWGFQGTISKSGVRFTLSVFFDPCGRHGRLHGVTDRSNRVTVIGEPFWTGPWLHEIVDPQCINGEQFRWFNYLMDDILQADINLTRKSPQGDNASSLSWNWIKEKTFRGVYIVLYRHASQPVF